MRVILGECVETMRGMADASIDAIVTDPPYELGFMGKRWDASGIAYSIDLWTEALRVLKPGGHLLALGGTRTYHRMACAIEDAGFEIRDSIHWVYGSGFPKSLDVSKAIDKAAGIRRGRAGAPFSHDDRRAFGQLYERTDKGAPKTPDAKAWAGWGTALKPAHEPIVVARKPLDGTVASNVLAHGTGAINVDGCRVATSESLNGGAYAGERREKVGEWQNADRSDGKGSGFRQGIGEFQQPAGRWPPNLLLTHAPECADACAPGCPVAEMDEQSGVRRSFKSSSPKGTRPGGMGDVGAHNGDPHPNGPTCSDFGGASRFFPNFKYVAKPTTAERDEGLDHLPTVEAHNVTGRVQGSPGSENPRAGVTSARKNIHPTVKPIQLMRWLVRLVTPPGGVVLDPFAGSGTTLAAAALEGVSAIGIEREAQYHAIAEARVAHALAQADLQLALPL